MKRNKVAVIGSGSTPIEPLVAVLEREGYHHGGDLLSLQDAAEDLVVPLMDRPARVDWDTLSLGYAGGYSSFLRHSQNVTKRHGVDVRSLLVELGKRKMVGGQEDMIVDVAIDLASEFK